MGKILIVEFNDEDDVVVEEVIHFLHQNENFSRIFLPIFVIFVKIKYGYINTIS